MDLAAVCAEKSEPNLHVVTYALEELKAFDLPPIARMRKRILRLPPDDQRASFCAILSLGDVKVPRGGRTPAQEDGDRRYRVEESLRHMSEDESDDVQLVEDEEDATPEEIVPAEHRSIAKFYKQRFYLFSKFDDGVKLDESSWYEVTPECIARQCVMRIKNIEMSERKDLAKLKICDACCGAGGNLIPFAETFGDVTGIDISEQRVRIAEHNCAIYGVKPKVVCADFLTWADEIRNSEEATNVTSMKEDVQESDSSDDDFDGPIDYVFDWVFLSPPWGGPSYNASDLWRLLTGEWGVIAVNLIWKASRIGRNVACWLPRKTSISDVVVVASLCGFAHVEVLRIYHEVRRATKGCCVYFTRGPGGAASHLAGQKLASVTDCTANKEVNRLVRNKILKHLGENIKAQSDAMDMVMGIIGDFEVLALVAKTEDACNAGDNLQKDGVSKRTKGGAFFQLMKERFPNCIRELDKSRRRTKRQR
eukprot:Polyplicarium_translucidae@DN3191_c0_g1_i5.p1